MCNQRTHTHTYYALFLHIMAYHHICIVAYKYTTPMKPEVLAHHMVGEFRRNLSEMDDRKDVFIGNLTKCQACRKYGLTKGLWWLRVPLMGYPSALPWMKDWHSQRFSGGIEKHIIWWKTEGPGPRFLNVTLKCSMSHNRDISEGIDTTFGDLLYIILVLIHFSTVSLLGRWAADVSVKQPTCGKLSRFFRSVTLGATGRVAFQTHGRFQTLKYGGWTFETVYLPGN